MKTTLRSLLALLLIGAFFMGDALAQNTISKDQGFNYQAVARDADGILLNGQTISVRTIIKNGSAEGTTVYSETHQVTTDQFGLFKLKIGAGEVAEGSFDGIEWGQGEQWLTVEMDVNGGSNYQFVGSSEILPVPYAIHAKQAERLVGGMPQPGTTWIDGSGKPLAAVGDNNNYYIDHGNGSIYKKENGDWIFLGRLVTAEGGDTRSDPNDWTNTGNSGTDPSSNYIGTSDANGLSIRTNATEAIRVDGSQNVGIGTSSPSATLHVQVASGRNIVFKNNTNFPALGIGTTSPSSQMHFSGSSKGVSMRLENSGNGGATWVMTSNRNSSAFGPAGSLTFYDFTNTATRVTIDNSGNMGIGTTSPSYKLHVNGKFKSDGITESSDVRWKKNIQPLQGALDKVMAMRGVTYNWRNGEFDDKQWDERTHVGFIAQELEEVLPNVVDTDAEGFKSVQYSHLVPVLVEAIKEQQAIINSQNQALGNASAEIQELQQKMEAMIQSLDEAGVKIDLEQSTSQK